MKLFLQCKTIFLVLGILLISFNVPRASASSFVDFHSSIKEGQSFEWRIETINSADGSSSWEWIWANFITISENDSIILKWSSNPIEDREIDIAGPLNYSGLSVTVGDQLLNFNEDETFFNFFISPLYIQNKLGEIESGFNALERVWFNSYKLPNAYLPPSYSQYIWNFDIVNGSLTDIGEKAEKDSIIFGHITSPGFFDTNNVEIYVFDVGYDAKTGILKWMKYPSVGEFDSLVANSSYKITENLEELLIQYKSFSSTATSGFNSIETFFMVLIISLVAIFIRNKKYQ